MLIKRQTLSSLQAHLSKKEISLIVGPRQAGKTFLMQMLKNELGKQGNKTLFLSLDYEEDRQFFTSQANLLKKIQLTFGDSFGYVFIDEIQRRENAGLFLKGIYDQDLSYKFIVSGSGSLELKENIHESLAGRKQIFEVSPLSFSEFVHLRTNYSYENQWQAFFAVEKNQGESLLQEYLTFGGYPRVVLASSMEEKKLAIGELYQSYLERDIRAFLGVVRLDAFANLVKVMASQIGGLVNITELSNTIGVSVQTIQNYLWYLEKTFIVYRLAPYFRNVRKEISRSPMFYFYDLGLRNYSLGLFGLPMIPNTTGHLFENFIYRNIREKVSSTSAEIHFWRSRDNAEVDFVVDFGSEILPIEVKYQKLTQPTISRSLRNFLEDYHPKECWIVHLGESMEISLGVTKIKFVPYHEFLVTSRLSNG